MRNPNDKMQILEKKDVNWGNRKNPCSRKLQISRNLVRWQVKFQIPPKETKRKSDK
jgi:hypothetical protein